MYVHKYLTVYMEIPHRVALEPTNIISSISNNITGTITRTAQSVISDVGLSTIGGAANAANAAGSAAASAVQQALQAVQQATGSGGGGSGDSQSMRQQSHQAFANQNPFAVKLKSMISDDMIAFKSTPEINESRSVAYKTIDPLHMPGAIQVYQNSSPRTWSVSNLKLFSRNEAEAEENLATINQLRAWTTSFFGNSATMLGAPPEVLKFSAYSDGSMQMTNIRNVPVVIVNLNIPYRTDIDYIKTEKTQQPFPTIMTLDMMLHEAHSPKDFSDFDIEKFKNGILEGF